MYLDTQNVQGLFNWGDRDNYFVSLLIGGGLEYLLVLQFPLFQVDVYYVSELLQITFGSQSMRNLFILCSHEFDIARVLRINSHPLLTTRRCLWPQHWIWSLDIHLVHDKLPLRTVSSCKSGAYSSRLHLQWILQQMVFLVSSADHLCVSTQETLSVFNILYLLQHALLFRCLILYVGIRINIIAHSLWLHHASLWRLSENRFSYVVFVASTWSEISLSILTASDCRTFLCIFIFIVSVVRVGVRNMPIIDNHSLTFICLTCVRNLFLARIIFDRFFILHEALWFSMVVIFFD